MPRNINLPNTVLRSMLKDKTSVLNVCHLNACSIFPKINYIREVMNKTNIHVICVSETWFNSSHTDSMVNIQGFNLVRHDRSRTDKKRGGGVAIYVKQDLSYSIKCKSGIGETLEFVFVDISTRQDTFMVGCVYNPPDAPCCFSQIGNVLNQSNCDHIILTGDFNLNLQHVNQNSADFIDMLCDSGSVVINQEPTHFMPNSTPSCIDLFICNNPDRVLMIDQVDLPGVSHHDLIVLS